MSKSQLNKEAQNLMDYLVNLGMYDLSKVNTTLIEDWLSEQDAGTSVKQIKANLEDYLMSQGLVEARL